MQQIDTEINMAVDKKSGVKSFDKMEFNPFNVPKGILIQDFYPVFKKRVIYHSPQQTSEDIFTFTSTQWDSIIRFIVLFVDIQSPFYEERDFELRRDLCLRALGIKDDMVIDAINSNNTFYTKALFEYFKAINNYKYSLWFAKRTSYHKNARILLVDLDTENDTEKRIKVEIDVNKYLTILNEELINLEHELFNDERIKAVVQEEATEKELSGYPERFAKQIEY